MNPRLKPLRPYGPRLEPLAQRRANPPRRYKERAAATEREKEEELERRERAEMDLNIFLKSIHPHTRQLNSITRNGTIKLIDLWVN